MDGQASRWRLFRRGQTYDTRCSRETGCSPIRVLRRWLVYATASWNGSFVGRMMPLNDAMRSSGARPIWLFYLVVDNVDETAKLIGEKMRFACRLSSRDNLLQRGPSYGQSMQNYAEASR
ncbi:MAG: hypothetical protein JWL62_459 [Hyphomicrobiales bacterium]|nr:hypothetical protein [Hyphomicrobiales bacterium]